MSPTHHFATRDTFLSEKSREETTRSVGKKLEKTSGISNHINNYQQNLKLWETTNGGKKKLKTAWKNYSDASQIEDQIKELKTVL